MSELRLLHLPVAHLERLFSGGGLPLVSRSPGGRPVTSATVRGEPGTGKTTLALALALAVAGEGRQVCYLTTEAFAAELIFKARMLGLPQGAVADIGASGAEGGARVSVQHLLLTEVGQASEAGESRPKLAIEAAWELFGESAPAEGQERFGAVVLDAFGLIDRSPPPLDLRERLVELIQHLEHRGIGVMVVAESGSPEASWLGYVTDLTFDLSLLPDERGQLRRKLSLPKSRFVQALAGPHDYGLDTQGRPAVWPELESAQSIVALSAPPHPARPVVLPGDEAGEFYVVDEGIVAVAEGDRTELPPLERLIPAMTDTRPVVLRLGSNPRLELPVSGERSPRVEQISMVDGYAALALRLERALQDAPGAHLLITGASALAASSAARHFAGSSLAALRRQGAPIWVQGLEAALLDLDLRARVRVTQSETTGWGQARMLIPRRAFLLPFAPRLLELSLPSVRDQLSKGSDSWGLGGVSYALAAELEHIRVFHFGQYHWRRGDHRGWRSRQAEAVALAHLCLSDTWGAFRWILRALQRDADGEVSQVTVRSIGHMLRPQAWSRELLLSAARLTELASNRLVSVAALLPDLWSMSDDSTAQGLIDSLEMGASPKAMLGYRGLYSPDLQGVGRLYVKWKAEMADLQRGIHPDSRSAAEYLLLVCLAERLEQWGHARELRRKMIAAVNIPSSFWT